MYNTNAKAKLGGVRKGSWTDEEDNLLRKCIEKFGEGNWHRVPIRAGLNRCRKSCRLRWMNYLKPNIKRGEFSEDEVDLIIRLHKLLGNRWSLIAGRIPGRTANDVKNYWNTHLLKRFPPSSRPPRHSNTSHNNICSKDINVNECHKKQASIATKTSKNITMKPQIIRPQPWTFPKTPFSVLSKPGPVTIDRPNGSLNGPTEKATLRNSTAEEEEEEDDDDDDNDDTNGKWWENLVEMYGKEEDKKGIDINLGHFNGPGNGLGYQEPNHSGGLNMWPTSSSGVLRSPINHVEEQTVWEDDDLWNFDVSVWE